MAALVNIIRAAGFEIRPRVPTLLLTAAGSIAPVQLPRFQLPVVGASASIQIKAPVRSSAALDLSPALCMLLAPWATAQPSLTRRLPCAGLPATDACHLQRYSPRALGKHHGCSRHPGHRCQAHAQRVWLHGSAHPHQHLLLPFAHRRQVHGHHCCASRCTRSCFDCTGGADVPDAGVGHQANACCLAASRQLWARRRRCAGRLMHSVTPRAGQYGDGAWVLQYQCFELLV